MDLLAAIGRESDAFRTALEFCPPDAAVPSCPGWTADDLLWHLTEVHAFWAGILRSGAFTDEESEAIDAAAPQRPLTRSAMLDAFDEHTDALLAELAARNDAEPAWFWLSTAKTVGSTRRMQAHEAMMHRIDAELAAGGEVGDLDAELAGDGISHTFEVMWAWWGTLPGFGFTAASGPVALQATDLGRSWLVQPGRWRGTGHSGKQYDQPGAILAHNGGDPVASFTGTAADLDRWLWGRGPEPASTGDASAIEAMRAAQEVGMQ